MKGYMDMYKPMITFLEEQDQYIKTVEKLPVIKHVQQKYLSTPSIVSQLEVESLKDKMSEYFNHYEREARQKLEEAQDVLRLHLNSCQTEKQRELSMKAHLIYEKRLNKIIKYCQKMAGEQKKSELDETVDWTKGEWTPN